LCPRRKHIVRPRICLCVDMSALTMSQQLPAGAPVEQGAAADIEAGHQKTTSTKQMLWIVVVSSAAFVTTLLQTFGYMTHRVSIESGVDGIADADAGPFMSFNPPLTSIVAMAAIFICPVALVTPVAMFVHWRPGAVLFGSQQMTDQLREKFANPFKMKYLFSVQVFLHLLAMILTVASKKCAEAVNPVSGETVEACVSAGFPWMCFFNILSAGLYLICLGLVFMHFRNPDVATALSIEEAGYASTGKGGADASRITTLEAKVQELQAKVDALTTMIQGLSK